MTPSALVTFPAATAFILGVIYAVGAVTRSAELSRAGVPVTVAFPLIPTSQELARGIQIFVSPGVLILVLILAASLVLFDVFSIGSQGVSEPTGRQAGRQARVDSWFRKPHRMPVFVAVLLLVLAGLILWRPLLIATLSLAILAVVLVLMLAAPEGKRQSVFRRGQRLKISPILGVAALVLGVSVALVFTELIDPQPLPQATLVIERGAPISGPLIAIADGNWYIRNPGHQVRAVDARTVRSALIVATRRRRRPFDESLFQLIRRGD